MTEIHFPIQDKYIKAQVEGIPGFLPAMYSQINNGEINWQRIAKDVAKREHRLDHIIVPPVWP